MEMRCDASSTNVLNEWSCWISSFRWREVADFVRCLILERA